MPFRPSRDPTPLAPGGRAVGDDIGGGPDDAPDRPTGSATAPERHVLSPVGRRVRLAVLVFAAMALVATSAWGEDDHFPFTPFRMYANTTKTTGRIYFPQIYARTVAGDEFRMDWGDLGLRRAEVEGQMNRLTTDHEVLVAALADTYHRRHPDAPDLSELRLQRRVTRFVDGLVVGADDEVMAVWRP